MNAEARFEALVDDLSAEPDVAPPSGGRRFGGSALTVGGSIFAMLVRDQVVVKLPAERVAALLAAGDGAPFSGSSGRPMREWAVVTDPGQEPALAREALAFVRARAG